MEMSEKNYLDLPQGGTTISDGGESPPEVSSGCPSDSGEGTFRLEILGSRREETACEDRENNPFKRRDSIRRTTPGSPAIADCKESVEEAHSVGSTKLTTPHTTENSDDGNTTEVFTPEQRAKKRRKRSSPPLDRAVIVDDVGLKPLANKVEEMCTFISSNKNVHKEIKKFAVEIKSLVFQAATEMKSTKEELKDLKKEFGDYKLENEKRLRKLENKHDDSPKCANCRTERVVLDRAVIDDDSFESFAKIADKKWEADCFTNVYADFEDLFKAENEYVFAIVHDDDNANKSSLTKKIFSKYPELEEAEKIPCKEGSLVELERTSKTKIGTKTYETIRTITMFFIKKEDLNKTDKMFNILKEIKCRVQKNSIKNLTISPSQGMQNDTLMKMTEFLFHGSGTKVTLKLVKENKKTPQLRKERGEVIFIDTEKGTYAETLMKMKASLTEGEKNSITNIRETRNGQVLLKLKNDAEAVSDSLRKIVNGRNLKIIKCKKKTVHILGMDAVTTDLEVREALTNAVEFKKSDQLIVKPLRPARYGTQVATIIADEEDANKLLLLRNLRIGLSLCPLKERIDLIKCYKCWKYGHRAAKCTEKNRSELCRNCAKEGHKSDQCKENAYCPLCESDGHAAGSGKCLAFRNALNEERKSRNKRRTYTPNLK
jgi:hypothetical protein